MAEKFKSPSDVMHLAQTLRERREALGMTLQDAGQQLNVDYGQLSRFENGRFKTYSPNLQKYVAFLQNLTQRNAEKEGSLGSRIEQFAARSPSHRRAAEALLSALEDLR